MLTKETIKEARRRERKGVKSIEDFEDILSVRVDQFDFRKLPSKVPCYVDMFFHKVMRSVLKTLTEREADVLRMRFGLDNGMLGLTFKEIGDHFKVGTERIRQIEAKALRKLRHPSRLDKLVPFMLDYSAFI